MKEFSIDKIDLNKEYMEKIKKYKSDKYYLVIDIGGTKILIRIIDGNGSFIFESKINTSDLNTSNPKVFVKNFHSIINEVISEDFIKIISISTPGAVNNDGEIIKAPNLKWNNLNLKKYFEEEFDFETILINDCNAGVLAEKFESPEHENIMYITISSGIGGGLILNNKLFLGDTFSSAEIGHLVVEPDGKKCICGNKGCLQSYCSGKALYSEFKKYFSDKLDEKQVLMKLFTSNDESINKNLEGSFKKLARFITIFSGLLDIKTFRLGGGMMNFDDKILMYLNKWTNYFSIKKNSRIKIKRAYSFPDSSIKGAELFAKIFEYETLK